MKCRIRLRDVAFLQLWSVTQPVGALYAFMPGGVIGAWLLAAHAAGENADPLMALTFVIAGFGGGALLIFVAALPLVLSVAILHAIVTHALGEKEIVIDANSFSENDRRSSILIPWRKVRGVMRSSRYIFVRVSLLKYSIVPKRDFTGEPEFLLYYSDLVRLWVGRR